MYQPLAELLRPKVMSDIIGQQHLIGEGKPISILAQAQPQSIILWGPPGVGKTTLANILIESWQCAAIRLSAVFSGIKEIKDALQAAQNNSSGMFARQTVIFVDEIHRFNKAQQDAFLQHVEQGQIILIGATTENPSFELNNALLSRMQVYVLNSLSNTDLEELLNRAVSKLGININFTPAAKEQLIELAHGDVRRLLNLLETIIKSTLSIFYQNNFENVTFGTL